MFREVSIRSALTPLAAAVALAVAPFAIAGTAAARPASKASAMQSVTVSVSNGAHVLLAPRTVKPSRGWITRGGAPAGKCPADSAQGALNVATRGHWKGSWYASYHEYFITGILGLNETSKKHYWGLYVNGKLASKGACEVHLRAGERLLFKVTKA